MDRPRSSIDSRRSLLFPSTPEPRERSSLRKPWPSKTLNLANNPRGSVHEDCEDSPVLGYFSPKTTRTALTSTPPPPPSSRPSLPSPQPGQYHRNSVSHSTSRSSISIDPADQSIELSPESLWTVDSALGFARRRVIKRPNSDEVVVDIDGVHTTLPVSETYEDNPARFSLADDISTLPHANEPCILDCLRSRYEQNLIYTFSGLFLIAINPYRDLGLYTSQIADQYAAGSLSPHIFAVAAKAFQGLSPLHQNTSQSILITGESGAGKTENTKRVVQWLMSLSTEHSKGAEHLEAGILDANPVLEAFGNAKTLRNDNSSRFGKYIKIHFSPSGGVLSAHIDWYLLEKSRVTRRRERERSFHIFYMLLQGASDKILSRLELNRNPASYKCLEGSSVIERRDDAELYRSLLRALNTLAFSQDSQTSIFSILAAILHLSNVKLSSTSANSQAYMKDDEPLQSAARILGISHIALKETLLNPPTKAGQETFRQSRNRDQVIAEISSLCRSLYELCFGKVVSCINRTLCGPEMLDGTEKYIGVLDIAGFEVVPKNGFEQLCINYTNERLQQLFNECMFLHEQAEYQAEKIDWLPIDFGLDLQPTIDLIESTSPPGLLSCIDEASIVPGGSDDSLVARLDDVARRRRSHKYVSSRFGQSFVLRHYAGDVEYQTDGWLDTNKDPLTEALLSLFSTSTEPFVADLFKPESGGSHMSSNGNANANANGNSHDTLSSTLTPNRTRRMFKSGNFRTVSQRHREQLGSLMRQLRSTETHFVRCILPNNSKKSAEFSNILVLDQLRCNGVLEGIRISTLGFPNRSSFEDFEERYSILCNDQNNNILVSRPNNTSRLSRSDLSSPTTPTPMSQRDRCIGLIEKLGLEQDKVQVGVTKVFLKAKVLAELDRQRDVYISSLVTDVQCLAKTMLAKKLFKKELIRIRAARTIYGTLSQYIASQKSPVFEFVDQVVGYCQIKQQERKYQAELEAKQEEQSKQGSIMIHQESVARAREQVVKSESENEAISILKEQLQELKLSHGDLEKENARLRKENENFKAKDDHVTILIKKLETCEKELYDTRRENIRLKKADMNASDKLTLNITELEQTLSDEKKRADDAQERFELLQHMVAGERWQYEERLAGLEGRPALSRSDIGHNRENGSRGGEDDFTATSSFSHHRKRSASFGSAGPGGENSTSESLSQPSSNHRYRPISTPPPSRLQNIGIQSQNRQQTPSTEPRESPRRPLPPTPSSVNHSSTASESMNNGSANNESPRQFKSRLVKPRSFFRRTAASSGDRQQSP